MKISNYFNKKECTVSATGDRLGIKNIVPNILLQEWMQLDYY